MPNIVVTPLPKSEVKLEFTVSVEEAEPYLEEALKISLLIDRFRDFVLGRCQWLKQNASTAKWRSMKLP